MRYALTALLLLSATVPAHAVDVAGTITRLSDGQPAVGAQVQLVQQLTPFQQVILGETTIGASGQYSFLVTASGSFYLRATLAPFVPANQYFAWSTGQPQAAISIALSAPSSITTVVVDAATQQPVPNASVTFTPPPGSSAATYQADVQGRVTLTGVSGGDWRICVRDLDDAYRDECQDNQYLPLNGALDDIAARAIGSGANVQLTLALDAGATISGHVTDRFFNAPASGPLTFQYYDSNILLGESHVVLGAGGSYQLAGIPPGVYKLGVYGNGANYYSRRLHPDVDCNALPCDFVAGTSFNTFASSAITNVDFSLQPGAVISGFVRDATTLAPIAGATVRSYRFLVFPGAWSEERRSTTAPDGSYAITHLDGPQYRVGASASGRFAQGWPSFPCYTEPCATGSTILLGIDQVTTSTNFALEAAGTVLGSIAGETTGGPLANADVVVRNVAGTLTTSLRVGASGTFETYGLPAGSYFASAKRLREGSFDCEVWAEQACLAGADPVDPNTASLIFVSGSPVSGIRFTLPNDALLSNGFE